MKRLLLIALFLPALACAQRTNRIDIIPTPGGAFGELRFYELGANCGTANVFSTCSYAGLSTDDSLTANYGYKLGLNFVPPSDNTHKLGTPSARWVADTLYLAGSPGLECKTVDSCSVFSTGNRPTTIFAQTFNFNTSIVTGGIIIDNTEFSYLNNVSSNIQDQLDAKIGNPVTATLLLAGSPGLACNVVDSCALFSTGNRPTTIFAQTFNFNTSLVAGAVVLDTAEVSYLNNVTSNIQDQLNAKLSNPVASTLLLAGSPGINCNTANACALFETANRPTTIFTQSLNFNTSIIVGGVTVDTTEFSYVDGGTSNFQTQLNARVTSVGATSPITSTGGTTPTIACATCAVTNGNNNFTATQLPNADVVYDLGSTTRRWATVWGGTLNFNGTGTIGTLSPVSAGASNLGSAGTRWNVFYGATINITGNAQVDGVLSVSGATGLSATVTVRNPADTGSCTLVFSGGAYTGGTC